MLEDKHQNIMTAAVIRFQLTKKIGGQEYSQLYENKLRQEINELFDIFKRSNNLKKGVFETLKSYVPSTERVVAAVSPYLPSRTTLAAFGSAAVGAAIFAFRILR